MAAIISDKFRIFNAKQFLTSLGDDIYDSQGGLVQGPNDERSRMYFFVGRPQPWNAYLEIYSKSATSFIVGETVTVGGGTTFSAKVVEIAENALLLSDVFPTPQAVPPTGSTLTGSQSGATAKTGVYRYAAEEVPPLPLDNLKEKKSIYDEIVAAKRITTTYARPVIRRYNWDVVANPKYDMWKPDYSATPGSGSIVGKGTATGQESIANAKFYVMNSEYEVFKCLYNGEDLNPGGATATEEPITSGAGWNATTKLYTETTGAGYIWKYMYQIPTTDVLRFLSSDFMPIVLPSNADRQATEAAAAAQPDRIDVVLIEDAGSGLPASRGPGSLYAELKGDGTGGVVEIQTDVNGSIIKAAVVQRGQDYTYVNIDVTSGNLFNDAGLTSAAPAHTGNASLEAILPPQGGHGADFEQELNAKRVMMNVRLTYAEGDGDFPVDNDFRRIGILKDPIAAGTTNLLTAETVSGLKSLKINGAAADYIPDERISQTVVGGTAYGTVVSWTLDDPQASPRTGNGVLKYIQTVETHVDSGVVRSFGGGNNITGANSSAVGTIDATNNSTILGVTFTNGIASPEIENNTGEMIYIENRRLITRAADQIEDIKLVIEF